MIAGMYASPNLGSGYAEKFDSLYPEIAEKHGLVLYPFFLDGIVGDRSLNQADGLHPDGQGGRGHRRAHSPSVETFLTRLTQR